MHGSYIITHCSFNCMPILELRQFSSECPKKVKKIMHKNLAGGTRLQVD